MYKTISQVDLAKWALRLARRTLEATGPDSLSIPEVDHGFHVAKQWQAGAARMHDVRQTDFATTASPAPAALHMKEHALVASNYAVKTSG